MTRQTLSPRDADRLIKLGRRVMFETYLGERFTGQVLARSSRWCVNIIYTERGGDTVGTFDRSDLTLLAL